MLYDLSTQKAIPVPSWAKEELKVIYPEWAAGKAMKLKTIQSKLRKEVRKRADAREDTRFHKVRISDPTPVAWRAKATAISPDGKEQLYTQYTTQTPVVAGTQLVFNEPFVDISAGLVVQPYEDDLMFVIHYGCKHVKGKAGGLNPTYEFDRPAEDAKGRIAAFNKNKQLEEFIYNTVDYSLVVKALNAINTPLKSAVGDPEGTEAMNREQLYVDKVKNGTETTRNNVLEIIGFNKPSDKSVVVEDENDLSNRLINDAAVKLESDGWYAKDKRGKGDKWLSKPFFETTLKGDDARFALVDFFRANQDKFEEFKKL